MKNLLLVFAKNKQYGKVKTRLAARVGDQAAYEVYARLFQLTETETTAVKNATVWVFFSDEIDPMAWPAQLRYVQQGQDLGQRMEQAFKAGFDAGYERVIGVGADLPDITAERIEAGFEALKSHDFVFGPAADGGYWLVGHANGIQGNYIFRNKSWSTETLLAETLAEIHKNGHKVSLLETLNDIDTLEDLEASCIAPEFARLIQRFKNQRSKG